VFYSVGMRLLPPASEDDRWVRLNRDKLGALLRQELRPTPGRPILDVGCGPGAYLSRISNTLGQSCTVVGVDVSLESLEEAHIGWPGGQLVRADAAPLAFGDGGFGSRLATDLTWAAFQVLGRVLHPLVDFAMKVQARIEVDGAWRGRKAFNIVVAERKVGEDNPR